MQRSDGVVEIALVGDVNLSGGVNERLRSVGPADPWGDTLPLLAAADVRIANLECTFTDAGRRWAWPVKKYHHRSDERNVGVLRAAAVDVAIAANNHVFDYGAHGLERTLAVLDAAGIAHPGAGRNRAAAEAPAIVAVNGVRIGIVAFMDDERLAAATESSPGRFYSPLNLADRRARRVLDAVRRTRADADLLIASAHWGPNWGDTPSRPQRAFGRALVDAGADFVFGHSGHVTRGVELHAGRPILHSAGDFVDDYPHTDRGRSEHGAIFTLRWESGRITRFAVAPIVIRGGRAALAADPDKSEITARFADLCRALGTDVAVALDGTLEVGLGS